MKKNPTAAMTTTVLETFGVAPPPGAVAEQSLPLTFFDMTWLHFHPMLQLLFYEIPSLSKPNFLEKLVPNLEKSLSLTLQRFFLLSGHVVFPSSPAEMPVYRYRAGDAIPLTVAESGEDFDDLVARNRNQSADKLYDFIPHLPEIAEESDCKLLKLLAVQVTLFPGRGVCIGITTHHCASDAQSFLAFLASWSATSKLGSDQFAAGSESPAPVFDRSLINYPQKLDSIFWERARKTPPQARRPSLPTNRLRSTYVFTESEIKRLKKSIQEKLLPDSPRISSFIAIGAQIWSTMARSLRFDADSGGGDAYFLIPIDLRARLEPAVPGSYFGNCLSFALPRIGRRELAAEGGASLAAAAMAAAIEARAGDRKILEGVEGWGAEIRAAVQESVFSVAGSTRLDLYGADFGWGKARKQDLLSIDGERYAMTLCKARDFEGGFEVSLSLPKEEMEAFDACFAKGIN